MISLGTITLLHQLSSNEARRKVWLAVEALTGNTLSATRLATATSEMCRLLNQHGVAPHIVVELHNQDHHPALCLIFEDREPLPETNILGRFFDEVKVLPPMPDWYSVRATKLLEKCRLSEDVLAQVKGVIAQKSRDELISEVQAQNQELENHGRDLEGTVRERTGQLKEAMLEAQTANESKSNFLANMSHEIRTPMNAIIGMTNLVQKTELTAKQENYLRKIDGAAHSLLGIINEILDFSKIEAGHLDIESINFNLEDVVNNVATVVGPKGAEKGLEVLCQTRREVPLYLVGDPLRLGQVLTNLLNNAVKFTEKGEIVMVIELVETLANEVILRFSVRDSGIGLSQEQISKLFQPFTQADASTTRKFGGTGLGLTISKRLVELMNGEIGVESEPGVGSTFYFTARFGVKEEMENKRTVSRRLEGMRVLVIDDNQVSRDILSTMLEEVSFQVGVAASGAEGIAELEAAKEPYEVVVMDWKMPGMDGVETARRIKSNPNLTHFPSIIMVTAYGKDETIYEVEGGVLDGFLTKPVTPSRLLDSIMVVLGEEDVLGRQTSDEPTTDTWVLALKGAQVLLAEDNEINQEVAIALLKEVGVVVTVANNGAEAVEKVNDAEFDAVLMDIQMPKVSGFEATEQIRQDSRFKDLPIIAMTAHAMTGVREQVLAGGMNDYITKPVDPEHLYSTLAKWVGQSTKEAAIEQTKQSTEGGGIVSLPGIDVESGLTRVAGNWKLYLKLLRMFRDQFKEAVAELEESIQRGEFEKARGLAHSIKGVAANVGADAVSHAAGQLEKSFRDKSTDNLKTEMEIFGEKLTETLVSVASLEEEGGESAPDAQLTGEIDSQAVQKLLQEIVKYLDTDLSKVRSLLESLEGHLKGSSSWAEFSQLQKQMDVFDTEGVRDYLAKIADQLGISIS